MQHVTGNHLLNNYYRPGGCLQPGELWFSNILIILMSLEWPSPKPPDIMSCTFVYTYTLIVTVPLINPLICDMAIYTMYRLL